jgi:hypothetical protein
MYHMRQDTRSKVHQINSAPDQHMSSSHEHAGTACSAGHVPAMTPAADCTIRVAQRLQLARPRSTATMQPCTKSDQGPPKCDQDPVWMPLAPYSSCQPGSHMCSPALAASTVLQTVLTAAHYSIQTPPQHTPAGNQTPATTTPHPLPPPLPAPRPCTGPRPHHRLLPAWLPLQPQTGPGAMLSQQAAPAGSATAVPAPAWVESHASGPGAHSSSDLPQQPAHSAALW